MLQGTLFVAQPQVVVDEAEIDADPLGCFDGATGFGHGRGRDVRSRGLGMQRSYAARGPAITWPQARRRRQVATPPSAKPALSTQADEHPANAPGR